MWRNSFALDFPPAPRPRNRKFEIATRRHFKLRLLWKVDNRPYFMTLPKLVEGNDEPLLAEIVTRSIVETADSVETCTDTGPGVVPPALRRFSTLILLLLFFGALGTVLYFALVPNVHGNIFRILPSPLRHWCDVHDDFNNFVAFAVLGFLGFRLDSSSRSKVGASSEVASAVAATNGRLRLVAFLGFVAALEVAQIWIPGRHSNLRDVAFGWAGVLTAWIFATVLARRSRVGSFWRVAQPQEVNEPRSIMSI